jgi:hypothetical protein
MGQDQRQKGVLQFKELETDEEWKDYRDWWSQSRT